MSMLRVLLVDDTERDLRTLERTLRVVGAEIDLVGTAMGGEEALKLAADVPCDVAIVDYRMPGMNGVEVAERLKEIRPECKVVILTAFDENRAEIEGSPFVDHYHEKISLESIGDILDAFAAGETAPSTDDPPKAKRGLFRRG
jgi:DNA-binding NarL/FixJ family response regulator